MIRNSEIWTAAPTDEAPTELNERDLELIAGGGGIDILSNNNTEVGAQVAVLGVNGQIV